MTRQQPVTALAAAPAAPVYRNAARRRWLRVALSLLLLAWIIEVTAVSYHRDLFSPVNLFISISYWLFSLGVYQVLIRFILPQFEQQRWWRLAFYLLLLYLFSFYVAGKGIQYGCLFFFGERDTYGPVLPESMNPFALYSIMEVASAYVWEILPCVIVRIFLFFYETEADRAQAEKEWRAMEVNLLRAQLQPRFVFNALEHIETLVAGNIRAREVIQRFTDLLHFSVYDSAREAVSLQEEMDFLRNYLLMEKTRHKESRVAIDHDFSQVADPSLRIKPLLLVNFMENAFKHGVNARIENAWASFTLQETNGVLVFRAANNQPAAPVTSGRGLGLRNVRRRLELEYPGRHELAITSDATQYTITLTLKL